MNNKNLLVFSISFFVIIAFAIFCQGSDTEPINLQKQIESKLLKDNEGHGVIFKPGVTCVLKTDNRLEVKVTMPENLKNCDLSALSILPSNKDCDIWLTVPDGNLPVLSNKKVNFLYIEKSSSIGTINISGIAQNKDIDDLCLIGVSERDVKTLPVLPSLIYLSVNFSQPSCFDLSTVNNYPQIKRLSFTNVKKFSSIAKPLSNIMLSLGLLKCYDYSLIKTFSFQDLMLSDMEIDIDMVAQYQGNTLKTLTLRKCHLKNTAMLEKIKSLNKLIVLSCSPQDKEIIEKLPIKEKKVVLDIGSKL